MSEVCQVYSEPNMSALNQQTKQKLQMKVDQTKHN